MKTHKIPREVVETLENIKNKGFSAYLVGGCVRDIILKKKPKDWDITTDAKPDEIMEIFPDHVYENKFGTVGVKTKSEEPTLKIIEITPYRIESDYSDKRHPDRIEFSDNLEDDLKRRDFTINSIALDYFNNKKIDPYNGEKDIKDKIIRTVGSPDERFAEDALRILRAVRLSAELGFMVSHETSDAIFKLGHTLSSVSRERIRDEFTKIIMSGNPMIGLIMAKKLGILNHISNIFEIMFDVKQNKEAHLYDVWEHSLRTLQHAADCDFSLEVRLAALFHDVAKPLTKRVSGNKTTFYGHEVVGAKVTRETLESLRFSKDTIKKTVKLVRWHMFFSDTEQVTHSAVRRLIARVGQENIWDLIDLRKCDRIGTGRPKEQPYRLRKFQSMIEEVLRDPISVSMLKINGDIIIKELHMKPGPKIGFMLHALLEEVLDDPSKNDLEYQKKRVLELNKLSSPVLEKMGKMGIEAKMKKEEEEINNIKQKRHVK